jgi:hypothetical protein
VIIAEKLIEAFRDIEACGYSVKITDCFFELSGDEGATRRKVFISEADLLQRDAEYAARQRARLSVINGGREIT